MTDEQFRKEVHNYQTANKQQALDDCWKYQGMGVDCVVVDLDGTYGLMLRLGATAVVGQHIVVESVKP